MFDGLVAAIRRGDLGPGAGAVEQMRVTLHESHVAVGVVRRPLSRAQPSPSTMRSSRRSCVPGPILATRTGGYLYDRRIVEGLRRLGWAGGRPGARRELSVPDASRAGAAPPTRSPPFARGPSRSSIALRSAPCRISSSAKRRAFASSRSSIFRSPPTYGLDRDTAARFEEGERRALRAAALVIVTGRATLPLIAKYELAPDRVVVVEPGTDRAPLARGSRGQRLELLSVATLNPGKGHESLLAALSAVPHREWHLTCAGSLTRHPETADRVRATVARLGLEDRVSLAGDLDGPALAACYDSADVFVLATRQETYGMAVAEALAHGLPVVSTMTGAIPELVGDDAGLLVPVGDTPALVEALSRVLGDAGLRARLAEGARRMRDRAANLGGRVRTHGGRARLARHSWMNPFRTGSACANRRTSRHGRKR